MIDAAGIERAGAAYDPVNLITFFKEEFGQVGTVLACNAGD
jgi:hypothetical protein